MIAEVAAARRRVVIHESSFAAAEGESPRRRDENKGLTRTRRLPHGWQIMSRAMAVFIPEFDKSAPFLVS